MSKPKDNGCRQVIFMTLNQLLDHTKKCKNKECLAIKLIEAIAYYE